jgi:bifunctional non-homologous end joining protein LigD
LLGPPAPTKEKSNRPTRGFRGGNNTKFTNYITPMLAKLHDKPFDGADWVYEIKWDGYRAVAEVNKKEVRLYSRNGLSFANEYPAVYEELKKIKKDIVLDGEIVALDAEGKPQFQLLQQYAQDRNVPIVYYVFDCLYVDGKSIKDKPLTERKEILRGLLPKSDIIVYCDHVAEQGKAFFGAVQKQGLEGMIAKRADSTYKEGLRTNDWLKVKHVVMEEAVIAGYTAPRGGRKYFGALVLGVYDEKGKFVYIGHTGTGFNDKTLADVYKQLQQLKTSESPFDTQVRLNGAVTWVKPQLVCNLKYTEITQSGTRRHPVFMGLRKDKDPEDVHEEVMAGVSEEKARHTTKKAKKENQESKSQTMEKSKTISGKKLTFSNLDKIYWPEEGYTKGDVIDYYNTIYPHIIKYMKDRPESLYRTPNGIAESGFFQKDAGLSAPEWVKYEKLYSESAGKNVHYIICNDKPTLLYLANLGCIEMNPWNSRLKNLDKPDYFVMDLDPSENNTFGQVVETALVIKEILDRAGAASFPKTSGASGLHIYVPLGAKYTYEQAKEFAHLIAQLAQAELPDFTSLERSLSKRGKDNIYIDYLQNRRGQTLSCAYSLRPKPHATVSTPLEWKEVKRGLHPTDFTFKNIMKRIEKKGDLFAGVLLKGIDMMKCIKKLGAE